MLKNQSLPVLYSFRRCPYAIRTRIAICYSGILVELREVVLRDKPSELIARSKKATVPVLVFSDNEIIDESIDIIYWALTNNDPDGWWNTLNALDKDSANQLITENDTSFKYNLDRYKYADRYPEHNVMTYRKNAELFLDKLEGNLTCHRFLINEKISIADISIFPFIRQYYFVDTDYFDNTEYTNLKKWLHYFLEYDLFNSVMKKYKQWQSESPIQLFPD